MKKVWRLLITCGLIVMICCSLTPAAWAFCGFYVAKADTKLYNRASQVAIARNGNRTVLTMANDYQGDVKDFAIVVPVPTVLKKEQVQVGHPKIMERLDAFSAPRLVEYFDPDPCAPPARLEDRGLQMPASAPMRSEMKRRDNALGVTVEAKFNVGEYNILILSAKESGGLETWLVRNGYKIPQGARQLLQPYVRQQMKFFVAKVNLAEFNKAGYQNLRPLQISYDSPRFMLPIRLGMVNAQTAQDLMVYILSPQGQAEVTNYRTVKIPSNAEIPLFVKDNFGKFYTAAFQNSYNREGRNVAFLEYAWNMSNCDPCSADPLSREELKQAGVFWLDNPPVNDPRLGRSFMPTTNVFITRLHVRYTRDKFPEDLMFQSTGNQEQFQGRYILRHPYTGDLKCPAGRQYLQTLRQRYEQQSQTLARLTGWKVQDIRKQQPQIQSSAQPWWWRFKG